MSRPPGAIPGWERRQRLLTQLQEGWTSYETLEESSDKPERTLRRDLVVLAELGHVIESRWSGRRKEWRIRPDSIRKVIEPGVLEMISLNLGRGVLGFLGGTELAQQMDLLFKDLRRNSRASEEQIEDFDRKFWFMPDAPRDYAGCDDVLNETITCLLQQRLADVWYRSRGQQPRMWRVEPLTLVVRRECLYVLARVPESDTTRLFDVTRILSIKRRKERFEVPADFTPEQSFSSAFGVFIQGEEPAEDVRIYFDGDVAHSIERRSWHHSARWEPAGEGAVLHMRVRVCPELLRWVLGFGRAARVLGPPLLVQRVRDALSGALQYYPPDPSAGAERGGTGGAGDSPSAAASASLSSDGT